METDPRHVLFRAGGERFALPLASVAVVVPPDPPFAHVPRTAPPVLGAMGLRGRVVAVVEMAPLLDLPGKEMEMNLYVGNLALNVSEGELQQAFEPFGEVTSVKIIKDKYTGESKGFGFRRDAFRGGGTGGDERP